MLPGLLLSIFFWAIHQFINADVKDLCENIQLNVFDHPLAAFNALYGVFINVKPFQLHFAASFSCEGEPASKFLNFATFLPQRLRLSIGDFSCVIAETPHFFTIL